MSTLNRDTLCDDLFSTGCPYLGMMGDSETRYAYPSSENRCYCVEPSEPVAPTHQSAVCLFSEYKSCPVYKGEIKGRLPANIRGKEMFEPKHWGRKFWGVIAASLLVGLLVFIAWIYKGNLIKIVTMGLEVPSRNTTTSVLPTSYHVVITDVDRLIISPTASPLPETVVKPTGQITVLPTITPVPSLTPVPPPTTGPSLETPFGDGQKYVIHQVNLGESLPILAMQYQTNREVIVKANGLLPDYSLQPGQVIVIMPGYTDVLDVETLSTLFLDEDISISEFAYHYGVSVDEVRRYNDLGPGEIISGGRWLIFPRRQIIPTTTPTPVSVPDLSTALTEPFGPNEEYILHKVKPGESVPFISERYSTSVEVIRAANDIEGSIQVGQILVIILGRTDSTGIEPFNIQYVEEKIKVDDLASQSGILLTDLLYFNDLEGGEYIPAGSWLIYPASPEK